MLFVLAAGMAGASRAQVTLPLSRYEDLRARAHPAPVVEPVSPTPFALEVADLEVTAGPTSARVVAGLTLTLYASGWQSVPLGPPAAAGSFVAARLGDAEGRVVAGAEGTTLVVRGVGRHRVELESVIPVTHDETATRPTWKVTLHPPAAAVVRGRLAAPREIEEVATEGSGLARQRREGGGWDFVGAPGVPLVLILRGRPVVPERARLPLRFETTSATAALLSRTKLEVKGWIEARVAQGRLDRLVVPLPEGLKPVAVSGPLAGWNVEGSNLAVTPLAPVESTLLVELDLSGPPRDSFTSPLLTPEGSARNRLFTRAALAGDGLLDLAEPGAARAADEAESARLPAAFRQAQGKLLALSDPRQPPRWAVTWAERTEVLAAQIDRLRVDFLAGGSGRASYQLWAEVRNRGAQQLTFALPAGFELAGGTRDGAAITTGVAGPLQALAVPLATGERAQVVHLWGILPFTLPERGGDVTIPLPALSAPAARVEVRALLPGDHTYQFADVNRAGTVAPPPTPVLLPEPVGSGLGQQVFVATHPAADSAPLPNLAGFLELQAAWSALSAAPAPIVLHVRSAKEKESWF